MKKTILFSVILIAALASARAQINIHSLPRELLYARHNDDFTVCVRTPGGEWQDLYEYRVMVDLDNPQPASLVQFDFTGRVEVRVKVNNGMVNDVRIRPARQNVAFKRKDNVVYFTLDRPSKLSLEINGDRLHNLHVVARAPETNVPKEGDPGVVYFGPGLHKPAEATKGEYRVPSNTTVYLAPGAVVQGTVFVCDSVENVRFLGRGIVLEPNRGFQIEWSENVSIEGITVINPTHYTVCGGQSSGITVKDLVSFSCRGWSDGIDMMSCQDVSVSDVFMRNSDDCIALYGHRWKYYGDVRNVTVTDAILWADIAHPINIGLHGDTSFEGNILENITFRRIDILEHDEDDRNYQGCMAFSVGDHNLVRNVFFDDVRVENIQEGQLVNMRVVYNEKYCTGPGRGIRDVTFRNIRYDGQGENPCVIEGYDSARMIENVTFENLVINGKKARKASDAGIRIGNFTKEITFR